MTSGRATPWLAPLLLLIPIGAAHAADAALVTLTREQCVASRLGSSIPASAIGEPVRDVTLSEPTWIEASGTAPAHCRVEGSIAPVDTSSTARPIGFAVALPTQWQRIGMQLGGGGMNGVIPQLSGAPGSSAGRPALADGIATYGSDSGHTMTEFEWTRNDEAIRNLGFLQMKKTHDAALVILQRAYGESPRYNYYIGTSQGGREALTVAQRYPGDYDGIAANVPIVNFSGLMLAPVWSRIQEKPLASWVPASKGRAIVAEFMRQCDGLDNRVDGVINNYLACRRRFDVNDGAGTATPWAAKRCPNGTDPDPRNDSPAACFTDAQIATLQFVFSSYRYRVPLADDNAAFGMWAPTTDTGGGSGPAAGLFTSTRYRGQEGAGNDAPVYTHLGVLGLTGFVLGDPRANPLDYTEGVTADARRREVAAWLDSTRADLRAFQRRGGKLIVAIGTDDTVASSGAQLDYYQKLLDRMGRRRVDAFARLYVLPQANHGLIASSYTLDGQGRSIAATPLPTSFDRVALLRAWVEQGRAPGKTAVVTGTAGSRPMCSYPEYPRYVSGDASRADSWRCARP